MNANTPESIAAFGNDSRKSGCHILVDDRAAGFPVDPGDSSVPHWSAIKAIIEDAARNHANPDKD